jgi:hypothetical protein
MTLPKFTLNEWIQEHHDDFITFSVEEIATAARYAGYTEEEIAASIIGKDRRFL